MKHNNGVLLVFTRVPDPGRTKTRLMPVLGSEGAADLHRKMLSNSLTMAQQSKFSDIELWCTPSTDHFFIQQCKQNYNVKLRIQTGNDLAQRMQNAVSVSLSNYPFVILIGSDCPDLTTEILNNAYDILNNGSDAVLGPSDDGGYYLIGLRKNIPGLFEDIEWSQSNVADTIRQKLSSLNLHWYETDILWDVDRPEDLERLRNHHPELLLDIEAEYT